jgi:hypothetical protein
LPTKVKGAVAAVGTLYDAIIASRPAGVAVNATMKSGEFIQYIVEKNPAIFGIGTKIVNAGKAGAYLLYSLVTFTGAGVQAILGTGTGIINIASSTLQTAATEMMKNEYQEEWAKAIAQDWPTAAIVSVAALTQAGVLSLTTIVALALRALGVAATGTGRAVATVGIYLWYLGKPKAEQAKIKEDAKKAFDLAKGVSTNAAEDAKAIANTVACAAAAGAQRIGGAAAAAYTACKRPASGATPTAVANADAAVAEVTAGGESAVSAASAEVAAELAAVVASPVTKDAAASAPSVAGSAKAASEAQTEQASAAGGVNVVVAAAKKGRGAKGGRKTRKVSSTKRRATRRRKPSKYLAAPVFAY